ncbi:acyl-CoA dehydrogenase family protein [Nonomuraea sp. NPDC046570]|uniref:acyl-CoA dehydrogenase family protein n=1 Tax=Nonomuraea sp. NPDC046570 TaxID=3155255 RepID=UPI0033FE6944
MTLLYTEVEEELRAAVRGLLADRCPPSAVLKRIESPEPCDLELWKTLSREIGVAGLLVPEEYGGAGASAREAAVVLEELGRGVAPVPFLTSSVLATDALVRVRAGELLTRLSGGEITAALVVPFGASPYRGLDGTVTIVDGRLGGSVRAVAGAEVADVLVVPVGGELYAVDRGDARVEVGVSFDLTRPVATVTFEDSPATALGLCDVRETLTLGAALLASEQLGLAEWCLETTIAYGKERYQFARPIGSFQAIKHRLADLWLDVVRARAAARNAADDPAPLPAAVAQAWNGEVAVRVAEEAVQLHGGIGMTWEHPLHLYLKRAKADEIALGTPGDHRAALASLADLPGPEAGQ